MLATKFEFLTNHNGLKISNNSMVIMQISMLSRVTVMLISVVCSRSNPNNKQNNDNVSNE
ncbi:MAG TPA: hypothetical protein DCL76_05975 [Chloroflexi bacterium]|nr:hypothetical protein [Chloroflexota bacterium]